MTSLTIELNKKLENQLSYLEAVSKRSKDFHVKEALVRYLEDVSDLKNALERLEKNGKTYTADEVREKLNLQ